nr:hypothetical protein [Tanacetum cinerariifolium]
MRYRQGDLKQITDIDFEGLGIKELKSDYDVNAFLKLGSFSIDEYYSNDVEDVDNVKFYNTVPTKPNLPEDDLDASIIDPQFKVKRGVVNVEEGRCLGDKGKKDKVLNKNRKKKADFLETSKKANNTNKVGSKACLKNQKTTLYDHEGGLIDHYGKL